MDDDASVSPDDPDLKKLIGADNSVLRSMAWEDEQDNDEFCHAGDDEDASTSFVRWRAENLMSMDDFDLVDLSSTSQLAFESPRSRLSIRNQVASLELVVGLTVHYGSALGHTCAACVLAQSLRTCAGQHVGKLSAAEQACIIHWHCIVHSAIHRVGTIASVQASDWLHAPQVQLSTYGNRIGNSMGDLYHFLETRLKGKPLAPS